MWIIERQSNNINGSGLQCLSILTLKRHGRGFSTLSIFPKKINNSLRFWSKIREIFNLLKAGSQSSSHHFYCGVANSLIVCTWSRNSAYYSVELMALFFWVAAIRQYRGVAQFMVRRGSVAMVRRGSVDGAAWLSLWCGVAQLWCGVAQLYGAAWLSYMVRRGSVMVRRGSVYGAAWLSWLVRRGSVYGAAWLSLWCGVAQLVARRLAVRQARVRFSARHHREVPPLSKQSMKKWREASANGDG